VPHRRETERHATGVHAGGTPALPGGTSSYGIAFFVCAGVIGMFRPAAHKKTAASSMPPFCVLPDQEQLMWIPRPDRESYSSKRSKVITLVQAAMKSFTKSFLASPAA